MSQEEQTLTPAHERLYRKLRGDIMHGLIAPGRPITLRQLAETHKTSITPAREAVRRLSTEGALRVSNTGRVATPRLSIDRIEELAAIRALIEPEIASRALPRAHTALIDRLEAINAAVDQAVRSDDPSTYIRANLEFHRTLYLRAQAPAMLALIETVWLQLGPTMAEMYSKLRRPSAALNHTNALAALKAGDEPGLRLSIRADVTSGLRVLTTS
ncbi:MAG: GntR family transcriptional regulator [Pseudomonadota bacterium]